MRFFDATQSEKILKSKREPHKKQKHGSVTMRDTTTTTVAGGKTMTRSGKRAECLKYDAPVISLKKLSAGDVSELRALRDACVVAPGYFTLDAEDTIPSALVAQCYARAKAFFALPLGTKQNYLHTQYDRETGGWGT